MLSFEIFCIFRCCATLNMMDLSQNIHMHLDNMSLKSPLILEIKQKKKYATPTTFHEVGV